MKKEKKKGKRIFIFICVLAFIISFIGSAIFKMTYKPKRYSRERPAAGARDRCGSRRWRTRGSRRSQIPRKPTWNPSQATQRWTLGGASRLDQDDLGRKRIQPYQG